MKRFFLFLTLCLAASFAIAQRARVFPGFQQVMSPGIFVSLGTNINAVVSNSVDFNAVISVAGGTNNINVAWSYSGPGTITIAPSNSFTPSATPTNPGLYQVTVTALLAPQFALTNYATILLNVTTNIPPTNVPPTVTITSPTNGTYLVTPTPTNTIYASPTGTAGGAGTLADPLDLVTAFKGTNALFVAGTTLQLRGGTYSRGTNWTYLYASGSNGFPCLVRPYPGETPIIDGAVVIGDTVKTNLGANIDIRGIYFTHSLTNRVFNSGDDGVVIYGKNCTFVNNWVYNCQGTGVDVWDNATGIIVQGNVITGNGVYDMVTGNPRGHGMYTQNPTTEIRNFRNNIVQGNYDQGIQIYSGGASFPQYYRLNYNMSANNGWHTNPVTHVQDTGHYFVDALSSATPVIQVLIETNCFFHPLTLAAGTLLGDNTAGTPIRGTNCSYVGNYDFGGDPSVNFFYFDSFVCSNNYAVSPNRLINLATNGVTSLSSLTFDYNTWISQSSTPFVFNSFLSFANWKTNGFDTHSTFSTTVPTNSVRTFVIPDSYTPNRAHIAVYNYTTATSVSVDVSSAIAVGTAYEVRNAFSRAVVLSGTYAGGSILLPMTGGDPISGNMYQTFVLLPTGTTYDNSVPLVASASDVDGSVVSVAFYANNQLIGTATNSPWTVLWHDAGAGVFALSAIATDNNGSTGISPTVMVTNITAIAPTIAITSPLYNKWYITNTLASVSAAAVNGSGTVTNIAFYKDGSLVGSVGASLGTFNTNSLPFGRFGFTAVATDTYGLTATSSPPVYLQITNASYTWAQTNFDTTIFASESTNTMNYRFTAPNDLTLWRSLVVVLAGANVDTRSVGASALWKEMMHTMGSVFVGVQMPATPVLGAKQELGLELAISNAAVLGGHPEVTNAPFVYYGFSASGSEGRFVGDTNYSKLIAMWEASGSWGGAGASTSVLISNRWNIPHHFAAGAIEGPVQDALRIMLPYNRSNLAQVTYFSKQTNDHVDVYGSIGVPLLFHTMQVSYPLQLSNTFNQPTLIRQVETNGWYMYDLTYSNSFATITNYAGLSGDPKTNSWFIDETAARFMAHWAQYNRLIAITSPTNDWSGGLSTSSSVSTYNQGSSVTVTVDLTSFNTCTNLTLYNGSNIVGVAFGSSPLASPQNFTVTNIQNGMLLFTAIGRNTSGTYARSNPVYAVVKTPGPGPQY